MRTGPWWASVLFALLLAGCGPDSGDGGEAEAGAAPGAASHDVAPDFTLQDVHGNAVRLSDFRGRTVVIDFWATWCPPCEFQVPELNALHQAHADAGDVAVLGIAVDVEGAEVVVPWIDAKGVAYTILLGDEDLARDFGAMGFPTLVVVRPDGTIDSRHVGVIEHQELEELVAGIQATAST